MGSPPGAGQGQPRPGGAVRTNCAQAGGATRGAERVRTRAGRRQQRRGRGSQLRPKDDVPGEPLLELPKLFFFFNSPPLKSSRRAGALIRTTVQQTILFISFIMAILCGTMRHIQQ